MSKETLEKIILEYLESHNTVSLATEKDGKPHAATVFYVNDGFDLFFLSSPTSRHGENFTLNPKVSGTINEDYSNWLTIKGIQLEGEVKEAGSIMKNSKLAKDYVKKYPSVADFLLSPQKLGQAIVKKIAGVRFYRLESSRIYFIDNEQGFGHREELLIERG